MYIVIISQTQDYGISDFKTFEEAFEYATKNNYGSSFRIAKEVNYKVTAEEL